MNMNRKTALFLLLIALLVVGVVWMLRGRHVDHATAALKPGLERAIATGSAKQAGVRDAGYRDLPSAQPKIPRRYRLGSNSTIPRADNDQLLLANYSREEQAIVRGFYSAMGNTGLEGLHTFDNALSFKNQMQLTWLANNGYPMPDDILMAARMPTESLLALAQQGNFKAKAILLVHAYQGVTDSSESTDQEQMETQTQLAGFQQDVLSDGSPFAGYVWAAKSINLPTSDGRAGTLAGYAFAETLGDERAGLFASEFARSNPGMNPMEALASYKAILGIASRNPSLASIPDLMKRPRFQMF